MTQKNFEADVAQLIQLVTHSIYSNKEIFLRELVSNANDAIQKAKLLAAQNADYLGDDHEMSIQIDVDEEAKTITLSDNGIGMDEQDVHSNIGTIAKSGTKAFLEQLKQAEDKKDGDKQSDLIGQFGIGFYSVFMVADKVVLETKKNGSQAVKRESQGLGSYDLEESTRENRGTTITIHLKEEEK